MEFEKPIEITVKESPVFTSLRQWRKTVMNYRAIRAPISSNDGTIAGRSARSRYTTFFDLASAMVITLDRDLRG